jgi:hypothetical protein
LDARCRIPCIFRAGTIAEFNFRRNAGDAAAAGNFDPAALMVNGSSAVAARR